MVVIETKMKARESKWNLPFFTGSASNYDATFRILYIQPGNRTIHQELIALQENYKDISQFYENKKIGNNAHVEQAVEGGLAPRTAYTIEN